MRDVTPEEIGEMTASDAAIASTGVGVGLLGQAPGDGASWYAMTIAPGGRLGRHSTPGEAVCFQIHGTATLEIPAGTSTDLAPGDVLLVGDDVPHSFRNDGTHESLTGIARLGVPKA